MDYDKYKKAIERSFDIVDKDANTVPFILNTVQDRMLKELSGQDIILKGRQQGVSSLFLAMFTVDFLMVENVKCVVIAHEQKVTQRLFDRVRFYLDTLKKKFPGIAPPFELELNSRHEMSNKLKNSSFYIGTAGARAFGHGDTINNLHVSELSRWNNQERILSGLLQAVPKNGRIVIETTANGYGDYFYNLWTRSNSDNPSYKPHFIPWFETPEYIRPVEKDFLLSESEIAIKEKYHLTDEQMAWRKWKIAQLNDDVNTPYRFNEQYPCSPEEAFIVSGNPVWSPSLLSWYLLKTKDPIRIGNLIGFNPVTLEENEKGYVKIFKEPNEFHDYVIGADVSEGIIISQDDESKERDFSAASVIDKNTFEQVATWHGRIDPDQYGRQLDMLGRFYNNALIAVERNAMGLTPLITLRDLNYPRLYYREKFGQISEKTTQELGWVTDQTTKDLIINDATQLLRERRLLIYDKETITEMMSFVRNSSGRAGAASSAWDDRVMSLLIGIKMLGKPMGPSYRNAIEAPDDEQQEIHWFNGVPFGEDGMPVNPNEGADFSVD